MGKGKIISLLLFALIMQFTVVGQQKLSKIEQNIVAQVNANLKDAVPLLKKLVDINSGTLNVNGVKKTGDVLSAEFKTIGFNTSWVTMPDSVKRAGHLVASIKGKKGKKILLLGHLDTVFEPDSVGVNSFRMINDTTATGQGVNDMKGGDVIMFMALKSLQQLGLLKNATVTAYFTGDEENAGRPENVTRGDLIETAKKNDIALAYEGANNLLDVSTSRRGSSSWQLKVFGTQAHSAGVFRVGYGAIYEAARILNTFREQLGNEKYLTFNPGLIAGGKDVFYDSARLKASADGKTNIISPFTEVSGDLRFITESQKETARTHMKEIVEKDNLKGTHAEINFHDGIPAMEPAAKNDSLVQKLSDISIALGVGPVYAGDPGARGAGDISYIAKYVACMDGLGAMGKGAHAPGEIIALKDLDKLIQRTAIFIYRLSR